MTNSLIASIAVFLSTNYVDVPETYPQVECAFIYRVRALQVEFEGQRFTNVLEKVHVDTVAFRVKTVTAPNPFLSTVQTIQPTLPPLK